MNPIAHDCVGAVLVRHRRILLCLRTPDRAWLPGTWTLPGGHLEPCEPVEDALCRELAEELGIVPLRWRPLDVLEETVPAPTWRLAVYAVDAWAGTPANLRPDEHALLHWCALDEAQSHLQSAHPHFADLLAAAVMP